MRGLQYLTIFKRESQEQAIGDGGEEELPSKRKIPSVESGSGRGSFMLQLVGRWEDKRGDKRRSQTINRTKHKLHKTKNSYDDEFLITMIQEVQAETELKMDVASSSQTCSEWLQGAYIHLLFCLWVHKNFLKSREICWAEAEISRLTFSVQLTAIKTSRFIFKNWSLPSRRTERYETVKRLSSVETPL